MPTVLWIPIGAVILGVLLGSMLGARSRSSSAGGGALIGFYVSLMATFPLLAIGLTTI
jgi:hypothetical protein